MKTWIVIKRIILTLTINTRIHESFPFQVLQTLPKLYFPSRDFPMTFFLTENWSCSGVGMMWPSYWVVKATAFPFTQRQIYTAFVLHATYSSKCGYFYAWRLKWSHGLSFEYALATFTPVRRSEVHICCNVNHNHVSSLKASALFAQQNTLR